MRQTLPTITLRAIEPEDLDFLYRIENDQTLWNVGNTNVPYSRYALHDYVAHASADIYVDRQVRLVIENDSHQAVGLADIVNFDPKHNRAEVSIVIACSHRRKGYARAALEWTAGYALTHLHLHQLFSLIATDNEPSLRLFRNAGFKEAAVIHDWLFDGSMYHDAMLVQRLLTGADETPSM